MWYPGQEGADATAAILLGEASPGGRLPVTFPRRAEDAPTAPPERYPGVDGKGAYSEGIFVGYRWYDKQNDRAAVPVRPRPVVHDVRLLGAERAAGRRRLRRAVHDQEHGHAGGGRGPAGLRRPAAESARADGGEEARGVRTRDARRPASRGRSRSTSTRVGSRTGRHRTISGRSRRGAGPSWSGRRRANIALKSEVAVRAGR